MSPLTTKFTEEDTRRGREYRRKLRREEMERERTARRIETKTYPKGVKGDILRGVSPYLAKKVRGVKDEKSWMATISDAIHQGAVTTGSGMGRRIGHLIPGKDPFEYVGNWLQEYKIDNPHLNPQRIDSAYEMLVNPKMIAEVTFSTLPYMAASLAAVGPGALLKLGYLKMAGPFLVSYMVEGQGAYDEAVAAGHPEKAELVANMVGPVAGMLEMSQLFRFLRFTKGGKQQLMNQAMKKSLKYLKKGPVARKIASGMGEARELTNLVATEGLTEATQGLWGELVPMGVYQGGPLAEGRGVMDFFDRRGQEFIGGGVAGGLFGGTGRIVSATRNAIKGDFKSRVRDWKDDVEGTDRPRIKSQLVNEFGATENDAESVLQVFDTLMMHVEKEGKMAPGTAYKKLFAKTREESTASPEKESLVRDAREVRKSFMKTEEAINSGLFMDILGEGANSSQVLRHLKNADFNERDLEWTGMRAFLEAKESVTHKDLTEFVGQRKSEISWGGRQKESEVIRSAQSDLQTQRSSIEEQVGMLPGIVPTTVKEQTKKNDQEETLVKERLEVNAGLKTLEESKNQFMEDMSKDESYPSVIPFKGAMEENFGIPMEVQLTRDESGKFAPPVKQEGWSPTDARDMLIRVPDLVDSSSGQSATFSFRPDTRLRKVGVTEAETTAAHMELEIAKSQLDTAFKDRKILKDRLASMKRIRRFEGTPLRPTRMKLQEGKGTTDFFDRKNREVGRLEKKIGELMDVLNPETGEKFLFINEIQGVPESESTINSQGLDSKGTPKKAEAGTKGYHELAMERAVLFALENGYAGVEVAPQDSVALKSLNKVAYGLGERVEGQALKLTSVGRQKMAKAGLALDPTGTRATAVRFLEDQRAIIKSFGNASLADAIRGMFTVIRKAMPINTLAILEKQYGVDSSRGNEWTTEQENQIADDFEKYIQEGVAPFGGLVEPFRVIQGAYKRIYPGIDYSSDRIKISDKVREGFDGMMGTDTPQIQEKRQQIKTAVENILLKRIPRLRLYGPKGIKSEDAKDDLTQLISEVAYSLWVKGGRPTGEVNFEAFWMAALGEISSETRNPDEPLILDEVRKAAEAGVPFEEQIEDKFKELGVKIETMGYKDIGELLGDLRERRLRGDDVDLETSERLEAFESSFTSIDGTHNELWKRIQRVIGTTEESSDIYSEEVLKPSAAKVAEESSAAIDTILKEIEGLTTSQKIMKVLRKSKKKLKPGEEGLTPAQEFAAEAEDVKEEHRRDVEKANESIKELVKELNDLKQARPIPNVQKLEQFSEEFYHSASLEMKERSNRLFRIMGAMPRWFGSHAYGLHTSEEGRKTVELSDNVVAFTNTEMGKRVPKLREVWGNLSSSERRWLEEVHSEGRGIANGTRLVDEDLPLSLRITEDKVSPTLWAYREAVADNQFVMGGLAEESGMSRLSLKGVVEPFVRSVRVKNPRMATEGLVRVLNESSEKKNLERLIKTVIELNPEMVQMLETKGKSKAYKQIEDWLRDSFDTQQEVLTEEGAEKKIRPSDPSRPSGMLEEVRHVPVFPTEFTLENGKKMPVLHTSPTAILFHSLQRQLIRIGVVNNFGQSNLIPGDSFGAMNEFAEAIYNDVGDGKRWGRAKEDLRGKRIQGRNDLQRQVREGIIKKRIIDAGRELNEVPISDARDTEPSLADMERWGENEGKLRLGVNEEDMLNLIGRVNPDSLKTKQKDAVKRIVRSRLKGITLNQSFSEIYAAAVKRLNEPTVDVFRKLKEGHVRKSNRKNAGKEFDYFVRLMQGLPLGRWADRHPAMRAMYAFSSAVGSSQTSASVIPNVAQPLALIPRYVGYKKFLETIYEVKSDPDAARSAAIAMGSFEPALVHFGLERGYKLEGISRIIRQTIAGVTGLRYIAERNNVIAAIAFRNVALDWAKNGMQEKELPLAKALRLNQVEIDNALKGEVSEETIAKISQVGVSLTQFTTESPQRRASVENIPVFRVLFAYMQYTLGNTRALVTTHNQIREEFKAGDWTSAMGTIIRSITGLMGAGMASSLLQDALKMRLSDWDEESVLNRALGAAMEVQLFGATQRMIMPFMYDQGFLEMTTIGFMPHVKAFIDLMSIPLNRGRFANFSFSDHLKIVMEKHSPAFKINKRWVEIAAHPESAGYWDSRRMASEYKRDILGQKDSSGMFVLSAKFTDIQKEVSRFNFEGAKKELVKAILKVNKEKGDVWKFMKSLRSSLMANRPVNMSREDLIPFLLFKQHTRPKDYEMIMGARKRYQLLMDFLTGR